MFVHEVAADTFQKYADDLLARLDDLGDRRPDAWVALGDSGLLLVRELYERRLKRGDTRPAQPLFLVDANQGSAVLLEVHDDDPTIRPSSDGALASHRVLVLDSIVNSGTTMLDGLDFVNVFGRPIEVLTYAVAVRRCASVVPNMFALSMGPSDRVFLPWHNARPNNRLEMMGTFRSLRQGDVGREMINSGQSFIDRVEWRDRWYTLKKERDRRILVCELDGRIVSFLNFTLSANDLHLDEAGTDKSLAGQGLMGAMLRYAETLARAEQCHCMTLWSHEGASATWIKKGFQPKGRTINCGVDGNFTLMERVLGSSKEDMRNWLRLPSQGNGHSPTSATNGSSQVPSTNTSAPQT